MDGTVNISIIDFFVWWCKLKGVTEKKQNNCEFEYLKDSLIKLIFLLACYSVLPYNSVKPNFAFLQWLQPEIWLLEVWTLKSHNLEMAQKQLFSNYFLGSSIKENLKDSSLCDQLFDVISNII